MKIDEQFDTDYETVKIKHVGLIDPLTGGIVFQNHDMQFKMTGFSSEIVKFIVDFLHEKREDPPTIYRLVEQICEETEILLVKVKIYESGDIFRANLYFTGKRNLIFRNFRASDAIALATYYSIPILVKKSLLQKIPNERKKMHALY